jgi:hypothetical protein
MKAYFRHVDWPARLFEHEKVTVNLAGETTGGGVFINTVSAKNAPHATWALLDQSDFIGFVNEMNVNPAEQAWQLEEQFRAAFGYTKRVSELCQRLEKIEVSLLDVVKKLDRSTQPQRSLWVPIESFAPEPYEVLKPITTVVTPVEDGFEAGLFEANLFSTGDTEVEAVKNLKSVIVETYAALEELGDSKLGPGPLQQRKILSALIRKAGS